jgi:hypothetical protein
LSFLATELHVPQEPPFMKISIHSTKPRNPLVAACLHRHAGAHRRAEGASRQLAKRELQRELLKERHPCT